MRLTDTDKTGLAIVKEAITADLRKHYTIEALASLAYMSRSNLVKKYKAFYGIGLYAELLSLRLALAKQLLDNNDYAIKAVAKKCGFRHAGNFSTAFKQQFGMSPKQYREL